MTDGAAPSAKKISWWAPEVGKDEYELVKQVLDSGYLNDGDVTAAFEREIAALVGAKYAVAVTSGTAAIFLALVAAGVKPGDEVLVPDLTFIATANAVTLAGAKPVLVDIDPRTLNLNPMSMASAMTKRTRAVLPVHVSGRAADMTSILKFAAQNGLAVIEDAAEALTSRYQGRCLGTIGAAGCFSFSPNKTITTGQGGMIVTQDEKIFRRLIELKDQGRPVRGTGGDDLHPAIGYNFKLTNLQSAVGLGQLKLLAGRSQRLRKTYSIYREALAGLNGLTLPGFQDEEAPQWVDALVDRRDALDRYLAERNIHCRRFWFPLHTQKPYQLAGAGFPASAKAAPRALWLPSAFSLTDEDVRTVCRHIREFLAS